MKAIFLFTCLLLLSAGALMAQSQSPKAGRSTKYVLFPDYDADMAKLKQDATADVDNKRKNTRNVRELIFTNYQPQQAAAKPAARETARKGAGLKLPSEATPADLAKEKAAAAQPVKATPAPSQESQAPKQ
ncbi:hypothetical protein [Chitinophaga alhagiae]|uniref:hypothetical protein n=1 Tax=Chitinophaga alhagiae TaxID=2203219 RepID=UPI000E5A6026|nr:hypothetical protein [Chitinophaga alhagiae]